MSNDTDCDNCWMARRSAVKKNVAALDAQNQVRNQQWTRQSMHVCSLVAVSCSTLSLLLPPVVLNALEISKNVHLPCSFGL